MPPHKLNPGDADARDRCWAARDAFYACADEHEHEHDGGAGAVAADGSPAPCAALRSAYEAVCLKSWIRYFDDQKRIRGAVAPAPSHAK
jgi:cytochrome c oxidase assembly factor 6